MRLFGIIGYPMLKSFSVDYFNGKFTRECIDAAYQKFPIADIAQFPALLKAHAFSGMNVTIPYKTAVMPFLQKLSADAEATGAVNCIAFDGGKMIGHNTDWTGFRESLVPLLKSQPAQALILGSGGAAKAVAYALQMLHIPYLIVSRGGTFTYSRLTPEIISASKLIINTTPLGMPPNEHGAPDIPYRLLTPEHLLYDVVYHNPLTPFLARGAAFGAQTKNGLEMLHLQAEANWRIWNHLPQAEQ